MLNKLEEFKSEGERNWVKSAKGLGDVLRRLKPAFRQIEISIEIDPKQKRDGIHVHISRIENSADEKCELGELCFGIFFLSPENSKDSEFLDVRV